ncbi:hypothetical protein EUX98_g1505 [Antrodiella citrinella]|uniref:GmrSD restriction endonucleases C-terminal domain-containing protein n=1 Tax=Antrodiella citrinella TaxID=2447956 RepID=A0A4S4N9P2_9APHY|nr:hypothetical protein EUX98_g1505 [Antrodiella citrinella]
MVLISAATILLCSLPVAFTAPVPKSLYGRALPTPIAVSTARSYLSEFAVDSNSPAYARDLFKTWDISAHLRPVLPSHFSTDSFLPSLPFFTIIVSGTCDTRETVLKRDGTNVVTDSSCKATSGNWVSPYDGVPTTLGSDLDIDHLVPLKEAWLSGARNWTPAQREAYANDLTRPQLVAITDNLNESKGDRDPAQWMPPLASFQCEYARAWVQVKKFYALTLDSAEKTALEKILDGC